MSEGKVVSLQQAREERVAHLTGTLVCIACRHTCVAVVPVGNVWVECPSCHLEKATMLGAVTEQGTQHWTCNCGNDLFHITPEHTYCPNCGAEQVFP